jgi:hypothetical protein
VLTRPKCGVVLDQPEVEQQGEARAPGALDLCWQPLELSIDLWRFGSVLAVALKRRVF